MSITQEERRATWNSLLAEQKESGSTVTAWCQEHDIQISTFYYWRKRLVDPAMADTEWVSLCVGAPDAAVRASSPLTLRVGAVHIDVAAGFDARLLTDVLRVLEARC